MGLVTPERGLSEAQGRLWGHALHARGTRGVEPWLLQTRWSDTSLGTFPEDHRNRKAEGRRGSGRECHVPRNILVSLLSPRQKETLIKAVLWLEMNASRVDVDARHPAVCTYRNS